MKNIDKVSREPYVGRIIKSITVGFRNMLYKEVYYYTYTVGLPHPEHSHQVIIKIQDFGWCNHAIAFKITTDDEKYRYIYNNSIIDSEIELNPEEIVLSSVRNRSEITSKGQLLNVFIENPTKWYTNQDLQKLLNLTQPAVSRYTKTLIGTGNIVSRKKPCTQNTKIYKLV